MSKNSVSKNGFQLNDHGVGILSCTSSNLCFPLFEDYKDSPALAKETKECNILEKDKIVP